MNRHVSRGQVPCASSARAGGFTLIELLIVLAIIGVLAGVVTYSFVGADRERDLQTEAIRLAALVELARTEALMRNAQWGLFVDATEYAFAALDPQTGDWVRREDGPFRGRTAPPGVSFSATAEALQPAAGQPAGNASRSAGAPPDIVIYGSGEQTPFVIEVTPAWGSVPWLVRSDGIQRTVATREQGDA